VGQAAPREEDQQARGDAGEAAGAEMVLWELTAITAYFLGLRRTYRLALRIQRRLIPPNHPRIRDFVYRYCYCLPFPPSASPSRAAGLACRARSGHRFCSDSIRV
jgi:hypothetical protein